MDRKLVGSIVTLVGVMVLVLSARTDPSLVAVVTGQNASASTTAVRVRVSPNPVQAGTLLHVSASVRPSGTSCGLRLERAGAPSQIQASKKAVGGTVEWRVEVARSASPGVWVSRVSCVGAGTASVRFTVRAARRPSDPVIVAAGDIACAPTDAAYNGGKGTGTSCMQAATANLLSGIKNLKAVLTLGDNQYENGALTEYQASYEPTWGGTKTITHPAPGNHEYQTPGAAGYFAYYGQSAGPGYYSFNVGAWHLISLDSEIDVSAGSPQEQWLRNDLQTHKASCTLAYWHKPRFSSGVNGNYAAYATLWQDLYAAGADVVLNGHDHDYERFAPQDPSQQSNPKGIAEFVVGTGGRNHFSLATSQPNSKIFNADTFGVLVVTIHPTSYDWKFQPVAGSSFTESGSANCH